MKIQMWQSHGQPETMQKKVYGPKLRLSCDNCSKSKVRCDHERPSCQRCFHAGNPCVYSLSRRTGKPSSKSTININAETLKNIARMKSASVAVQTESPPPPTSNSTSPDTTPSSTATTVCNDSGDVTLDGLLRFDMSGMEPLPSHALSDHNFATPSDIAFNESLNISNLSEYDEILSESIQTHGINKDILSSLGGGLDLWNLDPTLCLDLGGNTSVNRMGRASSCPSLPSSPLDITGIGSGQNHGNSTCEQLISSTLYNLSLPSTLCTTSPGLAQHSTIDRILSTSRQAMTASYALLQCSCAKNPSSALSIVLIIFKILDSYGTIARSSASTTSHFSCRDAGANRNSKDGSHESVSGCEPGPQTSNLLLSFPQMEQSLVLGASITIGMYEICAEDKRRIILNLLVSELRRVELLAEKFGRQFEGEAAHKEDSIYGTLRQLILSRVYAIHAELNAALQWA